LKTIAPRRAFFSANEIFLSPFLTTKRSHGKSFKEFLPGAVRSSDIQASARVPSRILYSGCTRRLPDAMDC
ncbi:MAG: hypothetical protein ABF812_06740, partial [Gluconobacter cerinus]|uniref:hypothetical protein n=1 Tax=Gluconobacter cerinus TaxID=38307 RepID=UPI0039EB8717